jgi:hypothetical protein
MAVPVEQMSLIADRQKQEPEALLTRDCKATILERLARDPAFREAMERELAAIKGGDQLADLASPRPLTDAPNTTP